jgi:hypothetical protein
MKKILLLVFLLSAGSLFYRVMNTGVNAKDKKEEKKKKEGCDTSKLVRTTNDTVIIKKYQKVYQRLGGVCYIIQLQRLGKLKKVSDSTYNIRVKDANTSQARADWQTYLYCPIGKPNGTITLFGENGDTMQQCSYVDERKEGWMIWWKAKNEILAAVKFTHDEQPHYAIDTIIRN